MIPILGSNKRLCDGVSRRDLLQIGGLGAFGLGLTDWNRLQAAQAEREGASQFGKAKSCIMVFLFGSPPQHETFDPKPMAPVEVQGEMKAISTNVPGLDICERLPQMASVMDRMTIVRSMTHPYPVHGVAYALSGMPTYTPAIEAKPRDPQHWPYIGSVVDYVDRQTSPTSGVSAPQHIGLPWVLGSKSDAGPLAGPYSSFLGGSYDPAWTDFDGVGTQVVPKLSDGQSQKILDPFGGTTAEGRFRLSATSPLEGVPASRLDLRQTLLQQFDRSRSWLAEHPGIGTYDQHQASAYSLLTSGKIRDALDIQREPLESRAKFGMTLFGQSLLAARRLVEAGTRFVSVFWDPFSVFGGSVWDTHANHFPRLKEYLLPVFDQAYTAFIRDLDERGLLDETLVCCLSEHGRTPKIDNVPQGGGRHHWSRVYSAAFAGGGIARGRVVGRSDESGGDVASCPVSPKDVLATSFHLLGLDPHTMIPDRLNRPLPIAGDGIVRHEMIG
ncbi:MAG: DUF1501 domain-containing protein [Planctomycetota bacterium]